MPDRVLFVSYSPALGGAERILLDLATGAAGEPVLAAPPGPLSDAGRAAGLPLAPLQRRSLELRASPRARATAPLYLLGLARELRRALATLRPRVVVAWNMRALLASVPALASVQPRPRLVFQHNDLLPGPAIGAAVRAAARRAQLTVCLSQAIARDLDPRRRIGALEVLPAGVDLGRFAPAPGTAAPDREVLVLGAIEPWKRPDLALEIAARLPELRLRLAGAPVGAAGGALLERLRERARRPDLAGRVELSGALADPVPALRRAAVLLHCADREPYGLALVEALACGVPVVAPAAGGPVEIVGAGGRLYPPGDAAAGALVLRDVLARRDELALAARHRAEELFDLERARRRYRELLAAV